MKRDPDRELSAVESLLWFSAVIGYAGGFVLFAAAVVLAAVFAKD